MTPSRSPRRLATMSALVVTSVPDVVQAAAEAETVLRDAPWWRGNASGAWRLIPRVYRDVRGQRSEQNMVLQFKTRAPTRHPKYPGAVDLPGWLFLMQHYGLPTRLLDWTESVLIATFFAVETEPMTPGALWALNPSALNTRQVGINGLLTADHATAFPLFESAFTGAAHCEKVVAVAAHEVDLRMMVQQSVFTIHDTTAPLDQPGSTDGVLLKFEVPAASKEAIRRQLRQLGTRRSSLFPDLESLAQELREEE